jgi:hypothetical protein
VSLHPQRVFDGSQMSTILNTRSKAASIAVRSGVNLYRLRLSHVQGYRPSWACSPWARRRRRRGYAPRN